MVRRVRGLDLTFFGGLCQQFRKRPTTEREAVGS